MAVYRLVVLIISSLPLLRYYNFVPKESPRPKTKLILDWTGIWENRLEFFWDFGLKGCPELRPKCRFTTDRKLYKDASAVLFRVDDPKFIYGLWPPMRWEHQRYVMYLQESPFGNKYTNEFAKVGDHFFNWTFTYRTGGDIYMPYGQIVPATEERKLVDFGDLRELFRRKTKLAAWWVSHCETQSKRELYVQELQKYMSVDVYGRCGPLKCNSYISGAFECEQMLVNGYKFYLAFENSICHEYISEKFFQRMKFPIILVVLRDADYKTIAPKNSYIAADQFKSAEELAGYLKFLAANENEYLKYFQWRKSWAIVQLEQMGADLSFCKLCQMLQDDLPRKSYTAKQLVSWWYWPQGKYVCDSDFGTTLLSRTS